MMDVDDDFELELAMSMSKDDGFSEKLDDDLDYAFALSLQSAFGDEDLNTLHPPKKKTRKTLHDDSDYVLALSLQSEFNKEPSKSPEDPAILSPEKTRNTVEDYSDYVLALSLQYEFNKKLSKSPEDPAVLSPGPSSCLQNGSRTPSSIVDNEWEVLDPIPNIYNLFIQFNKDYFWGTLAGVEVRWSPRMTLCAGICCYEGRGGLCSVRLSQPLLKYRPRRDLVETLLHEMIHAYLFVTHNNKDHDAHGPEFLKHMTRINRETGTKISIYHSFHNEVDIQRKHWWKCNGPCQHQRPFYGLVKRAMNRAPAPRDPWWGNHKAKCGGDFVKIKEPDDYGTKKAVKRKQDVETGNVKDSMQKDIQNYFSPNSSKKANINTLSKIHSSDTENKAYQAKPASVHADRNEKKEIVPFSGKGFKLGTGVLENHNSQNLIPVERDLFYLKHSSPNLKPEKKPGPNLQDVNKPPIGNGYRPKGGNNTTHNRGPPKPSNRTVSRNRGSTTIVVNKNLKFKDTPKETQEDKKQAAYFTGTGHVLGELPSSKENQNNAKSPTSRQESIDTFFKGATPKHKPTDKKVVVFSSDSEDESVPNSSNANVTNIDSKLVPCPVCGTRIKGQVINYHLDICLNNS